MRIWLLLLTVLVFLRSCKEEDDSATSNPYAAKILAQLNPTDTFLYYSGKSNNKRIDSTIKQDKADRERWLNLQSIERGFDSVQIRIWYGCAILGNDRLIVLANANHSWRAEVSKLQYQWDSLTQRFDTVTRSVVSKLPQSGWRKFINQLFDLKTLTLPNEQDIPNFAERSITDGCSVEIEIATKDCYRYYYYTNPDLYEYWQAKNMISILKLINSEFGMKGKYEWPPQHQDITKNDTSLFKVNEVQLQDIKEDSIKH